jgi:uncharacterized membrane protein YfhO
MKYKNLKSPENRYFFLVVGLLALVSFFVLRDFLLLQKLFIYTDVAKDMWLNVWPNYFHISEYLKSNGFPTWTFNIGTGANIFAGSLNRISIVDPFVLIFALFASKFVIYLFPFVLYAKIILAGAFFYIYLKKVGFQGYSSTVGALLYAFSAYMILYSGWYGYTTAVVFLPLLLLAIEYFVQNRKSWLYLVICYAWLALYHPLDVYFYAVLPACYYLFRAAWISELSGSKLVKFLWLNLLRYSGLVVFGICLAAIFFLPNLMTLLQSPRVTLQGSVSETFLKLVGTLPSNIEFKTTLARFFSSDLFGVGNQFAGWRNYLEAPMLYAGLLPLIILPQAFVGLKKRKVIILATFLTLSVLLLFVPALRFVLNGFSGDYYRLIGYFTPFVFIFVSVLALDSIFEKKNILAKPLLAVTALCLAGILTYLSISSKTQIDHKVFVSVIIFLSVYFLLFLAMPKQYYHYLKVALLALVVIELSLFSYKTVDRPTLEINNALGSRGYNDSSNQLISWVTEDDKSLYRIDKNFESVFCCSDALVQKYHGTDFYQSFIAPSYLDFLINLKLIDNSFSYRASGGVGGNPELLSLLGVKYYITGSSDAPFPGYELIRQEGNAYLFKNNNFGSFGSVYGSYTSGGDFTNLTEEEKSKVMLKAVVIEDDQLAITAVQKVTIEQILENFDFQEAAQAKNDNGVTINSFNQKRISGTVSGEKGGIIFFPVPYDIGWQLDIDSKEAQIFKSNLGFIGSQISSGKHNFSLVYKVPYLTLGMSVSIISILIFVLFLYLRAYSKKE